MHEKFLHRPVCELCGSEEKMVLFSKKFTDPNVWDFLERYYEGRVEKDDLIDGEYEVVKCFKCGFVWQAYILINELMDKLYNFWISPQQSLAKKKYAEISFFNGYAREAASIVSFFSTRAFEIDVLDFGMGWGYWCQTAKAFGYNVSGFEISKDRIEFARKNGIDVIRDFSEITNRRFDFINAEQVFEHVPDPLQTLKMLVRSLKNGGVVRISVPNGKGVEQELAKSKPKVFKNAITPLEHINCFTHQTLIEFGKRANLELMRQPFLLSYRRGLMSYAKGILSKYHKQYFGTSLYFKKRD